jgi:hypothetical protein
MFRSCNPLHVYSTECVLLRVLQTSYCISSRDLHTFLALFYRHFHDKNLATVAASRWISDVITLDETARTLVTEILDKQRYTSRRECAAHFNAY